jgi:hypothetical protein
MRARLGSQKRSTLLVENIRLLATAWLATVAWCSTEVGASVESPSPEPLVTPPPITLSPNDVSFYEHIFGPEFHVWNRTATCGYQILGNSQSRRVPRPGWAISIDEVMDNDTPFVRVRGASFRVVTKDGKPSVETRPPIRALAFTLKAGGEPLITRIVGRPNADNSINGILETAPAQQLLEAFYNAQPIAVSLTYQDGATEVLEVRNWKPGASDDGFEYLPQCLKNLHPLLPGVRYFVYELGPADPSGPIRWGTKKQSYCFKPTGKPDSCTPP